MYVGDLPNKTNNKVFINRCRVWLLYTMIWAMV